MPIGISLKGEDNVDDTPLPGPPVSLHHGHSPDGPGFCRTVRWQVKLHPGRSYSPLLSAVDVSLDAHGGCAYVYQHSHGRLENLHRHNKEGHTGCVG